jgi:tRNA(Ile)-lysidine synthase
MHGAARSAAERFAEPAGSLTGPVTPAEFDRLMAPLGPFGPAPRLVVGVSGGPHSLALILLVQDWTSRRGGRALAAICDHGLRPGKRRGGRGVAAALGARGIGRGCCRSISPRPSPAGPGPAARRDALLEACREAGALHLLLGHHAEDQGRP